MSPAWRGSEKGSGGPGAIPEPSRPFLLLGAIQSLRRRVADDHTRSTNSGPAAPARRSMPPRASSPLPPPPLPLDHPPQRLTARRAAEPLARAPLRGREVRLRTPDGRSKKIRIRRLGADPRGGVSGQNTRCPAPRCRPSWASAGTPSLGAATPITPALAPAFLLAVGGPPILPAGLSPPPPPRRRAALGATVSGLRMGRSEELLASLEETPPLSRPTSPLTGPRFAASLDWAQGSCELPTAKPRVRSPLRSAPRRLFSSHRPSWPIPLSPA